MTAPPWDKIMSEMAFDRAAQIIDCILFGVLTRKGDVWYGLINERTDVVV
jgi:hypothetical protein